MKKREKRDVLDNINARNQYIKRPTRREREG